MAMRFAIANPSLTTTEIGLANIEQLDHAIEAIRKGPLSAAALKRLGELQAGFAGEVR
jgi:aryl-alcohol dehydrogenase-like predicted oxidoreductase